MNQNDMPVFCDVSAEEQVFFFFNSNRPYFIPFLLY